MQLKDGRISILIGSENTTIEIIDGEASTTFCKITLTPEQLSSALSRLSNTECTIDINGLDKVGKVHENKTHVFEIPKGMRDKEDLYKEAIKTAPEGWKPDKYFSSQNTFFSKDGKDFVRVTIRRWI